MGVIGRVTNRAALAELPDLAACNRLPTSAASTRFSRSPSPARNGDREIILARRGFDSLAFVADQLAHALFRFFQPMVAPTRLVLEAHAPLAWRG